MTTLISIDEQISAICPIEGVSSDGSIQFDNSATAAQRSAAIALMATLLPVTPTPEQLPYQMTAVLLSRLKDANKSGDWSSINDITLSLFNLFLKG